MTQYPYFWASGKQGAVHVSRRYMPVEKLKAICNDNDETAMIAAQ